MKSGDWALVFWLLIFGVWIGFASGATLAENSTSQRWQREAIEHNAASYVCDPKTGETVFRWKDGE